MHEQPTAAADDPGNAPVAAAPLPGAFIRLLRSQVLGRLAPLRRGHLTIHDPLGRQSFGQGVRRDTVRDAAGEPAAELRLHDLSAYVDMATGGTIGAAEAYMRGKWSASDLTALVRIMVANRQVLEGIDSGLAVLARPWQRLRHWLRRNTRRQARRNISAHYDLGNDFYRLFLDRTMCYSAGIFPRDDSTLEEASAHKLDVICGKLDLGPADHLLEIGTGWGGLALHAAGRYGCRVTTTTISPRQREFAEARVREAGLADRVTVLGQDYRDLRGRFDKLVSVEMIEAVGLRNLELYFRACSELLRPGGRMVLQAIVIADRFYEHARRSVDFIQKYIFPGGALPSLGAMQAAVIRGTDLQLVHLQDIGSHYARTLREWRRRFLAQLAAVRQLGYPEEFIRMWEFYLAYCEGGFLERAISDVQMVFDKPQAPARA